MFMKTKDVADLVRIPMATITRWVQDRTINPAIRSRPGRGKSHCFTSRQVTALVLIGVFHENVGDVCQHFINNIMSWFEGMTDEHLAYYLFDDAEGSLGPKPSWWKKSGSDGLNFHLYEQVSKRLKETSPIIIEYFAIKRKARASMEAPESQLVSTT